MALLKLQSILIFCPSASCFRAVELSPHSLQPRALLRCGWRALPGRWMCVEVKCKALLPVDGDLEQGLCRPGRASLAKSDSVSSLRRHCRSHWATWPFYLLCPPPTCCCDSILKTGTLASVFPCSVSSEHTTWASLFLGTPGRERWRKRVTERGSWGLNWWLRWVVRASESWVLSYLPKSSWKCLFSFGGHSAIPCRGQRSQESGQVTLLP